MAEQDYEVRGYIDGIFFWKVINQLKNQIANLSGGGVQSITGDLVDNTDPQNPKLSMKLFMQSLPGYDPNDDDQGFLIDHNGDITEVIINHQ